MKKTYIHPNLQVVHISVETIIAGSIASDNKNKFPLYDDVGNGCQFVRPRNDEDENEEDWDF